MNLEPEPRSHHLPGLAAALALVALPAQAIVGGTPTASFASVGTGVQVAPDWVFTVEHAALGIGATYGNGFGARTVAARYDAPGSGTFPANDFALLRLAPAATAAPFLAVNGSPVPDGTFDPLPVTIVSAANHGPARGSAFTTVSEAAVMGDDNSKPPQLVTVNWLVSWDAVVHVQGGDSGGGLFAGHVGDSSVLLGITSALITDEQNSPLGSAFVQPAAYRSWIDSKMADDLADTQALLWTTAVPEPATWALWAAGLAVLVARGRRPRKAS